MRIFTKRNALVGWVALKIASRQLRKRVEPQKKRRRGMLVATGAAGATAAAGLARAVHQHRRRGRREPTHATL